ncbi:MAG: hypothetical protein KDB65_13280 [Calditrichaeota bacterium]|nr:hypothetical protein [Calditrichota bacterium]MCB9367634.1 hypothetical protein [Calditrichota bacterium]
MYTVAQKQNNRTVLLIASMLAAVLVFAAACGSTGGTSSKFAQLIKIKPMDVIKPIVLRGTATPKGQDDYLKGLDAYMAADYKKGEKYFATAVKASPEQGDWWLILGVCQVLQHDDKNAVRSLQKANTLVSEPSLSKAHWFLAQAYLMGDDASSAAPLLEWLSVNGVEHSADAKQLLQDLRDKGAIG